MNTLRNQVAQRLEVIPDDKLPEVLNFLNYLVWQNENLQTQEDTGNAHQKERYCGECPPYYFQHQIVALYISLMA